MSEHSHFHMIDIGKKIPTTRLAVASGKIFVGKKTFLLIKNKQLPKGDPLVLAEIAGIQGAKKTADIIPLCHPLPLEKIEVVLHLEESSDSIIATSFVSTTSKTGVEMEAISAVNAALITIYDLSKMIEPNLIITDIKLLIKKGGKSGLWLCHTIIPEWIRKKVNLDIENENSFELAGLASAVVTLSDRANNGTYEDISGLEICNFLKLKGSDVVSYDILPDNKEQLHNKILAIIKNFQPSLILTTGGTGVSKRDITPETISELADKILPGIGELLRIYGSQYTVYSWISRSNAYIVKDTLVICLPGSSNAVKEGLHCLAPILNHLIKTLHGSNHDKL